MPRYRLDIEYDGTGYAGWQRQDDYPSIQQAIETAIHGFCGETVAIRGAGRTDAGVHAWGQVAHVDLGKQWPDDTVRDAINAHLQMARERIVILAAREVSDAFDARFSATRTALCLPHHLPPRAAGDREEPGALVAAPA
jgi:tRNA pseudouridine38-40 synthase